MAERQPFSHQRRILFLKNTGWVLILDHVEGSGEHLVEQFWSTGCELAGLSSHAYQLDNLALLLLDQTLEISIEDAWRSPAYGVKEASKQIVGRKRTQLPFYFAAAIVGPSESPQAVRVLSTSQIAIGDSVWTFPPENERT